MGTLLAIFIIWSLIGGGIGYAIGKAKGRHVAGWWLGFALGWIGWIIVATLSPSVDAQARRDVAVADAVRRLNQPTQQHATRSSGPFVRPTVRTTAERSAGFDATRAVREVASHDANAAQLVPAVDRFASDVCPQRTVNEWMFTSGDFPLVARHDGVLYLASAGVVRRVPVGDQPSYDETPTGLLLGATIDRVWLPAIRPAVQAQSLLAGLRASRVERQARFGEPGYLPSSGEVTLATPTQAPSIGAAPVPVNGDQVAQRSGTIRERLLALDALRDDGTISLDEHASRRRAILAEL